MKKITLLLSVYLFCFTISAFSQSTITFRVNVSYEIENGLFNPEEHSVVLMGNVHPLSMNRQVEMIASDADSTMYIAEVRFSNGVVQRSLNYIFRLNLNGRYMNEDVPRNLIIPNQSVTLDAIYFNSYAW